MSYGFESAPWHWGTIKNCNEKQYLVFLEREGTQIAWELQAKGVRITYFLLQSLLSVSYLEDK